MIGCSLNYKRLLSGERYGELLPLLWERGVSSIEVRAVPPCADADEVFWIAERLWNYGFTVSVHSSVKTVENAVSEVLLPLERMVSALRQRELVVTVHPIIGDNAAMLTALSDYITEKGFPIRIALENERKMPDKTVGDSLSLVFEAVTAVNRDNVGICFDMGHLAWYNENYTDFPNQAPPKEFLSRVIHTHIHACVDGVTHYPLDSWREPFSYYIEKLSYNYFGVYNLEISPERLADRSDERSAYLISVDTLRENLPVCAALYRDIRLNYDSRFRNACSVLDGCDGCRMALLGPSSYLFNTAGYRWAMDVAFRNIRQLAEAPSRIREYLGGIDLMVLTHGHEDHMEESTIHALSDTDITWLVPEFLYERVVDFGVRPERIVTARVGERYEIGKLRISVLPGRHFRSGTENGVPAVGYLVESDGMPSLAFPSDVRDYSTEGMESLNADYCFAHLWLDDDSSDPELYTPKLAEFADFMLNVSSRNILITHLYESGRREYGMWQSCHAELARKEIIKRSPQTKVLVPEWGEVLELAGSTR